MAIQTTVRSKADATGRRSTFLSPNAGLSEFTIRAVLLGLILTVILGSANAYLGLRAGMTIAATYPAAVISMALLRVLKGSLLEENIARTIGSVGESMAAGALFTLPAFVMAGLWPGLVGAVYWKSVALMVIGGILGILFVTLLRRILVEDPELPFPESMAAAEIHKAGQQGSKGAKTLFANMGFGGLIYLLGATNIFSPSQVFRVLIGAPGKRLALRTSMDPNVTSTLTGGTSILAAPDVSPAYLGVGYIIGPRLAALVFAGGVLSWGFLVPILTFLMGPYIEAGLPLDRSLGAPQMASAIYFSVVRPVAVGGMLVGALHTLFRMRKQIGAGLRRAVEDLKKSASSDELTDRTDRDLHAKVVFVGLGCLLLAMVALYFHFMSAASGRVDFKIVLGAIVAALVMLIMGFFFAAVSGRMVGMIGSSSNPSSGLTICTLLVAALLMVSLGLSGIGGVAVVLGVAAVACTSCAVSGEMMQDLKVGHILSGTPSKMEAGDILGVFVSALALFFPLAILDKAYHFGSPALPAPQAGLMATLAQGIVGGDMPWPLVIVGIVLGVALILIEVRSPMLFSVGMYLPLGTTSAIFVGGIVRWVTTKLSDRANFNDAQKARVENTAVLTASGLISGEALCGLVVAGLVATHHDLTLIRWTPPLLTGLGALAVLAIVMITVPLAKAGRPEDPPPAPRMM